MAGEMPMASWKVSYTSTLAMMRLYYLLEYQHAETVQRKCKRVVHDCKSWYNTSCASSPHSPPSNLREYEHYAIEDCLSVNPQVLLDIVEDVEPDAAL